MTILRHNSTYSEMAMKFANTVKNGFANVPAGLPLGLSKPRVALIKVSYLFGLSLSGVAIASDGHGVHSHGVANLTLAFASGALEVQFESPAMNIFAFEHSPENQQQVDLIQKSKLILELPENVLSIDGARCSVSSVSVEVHGPAGQPLNMPETHEHRHVSTETKDEGHSKHHSEISAAYVFDCEGSEALHSINFLLFDHFSRLEKVNVNWVTESRQGQTALRPDSILLELPLTK